MVSTGLGSVLDPPAFAMIFTHAIGTLALAKINRNPVQGARSMKGDTRSALRHGILVFDTRQDMPSQRQLRSISLSSLAGLAGLEIYRTSNQSRPIACFSSQNSAWAPEYSSLGVGRQTPNSCSLDIWSILHITRPGRSHSGPLSVEHRRHRLHQSPDPL